MRPITPRALWAVLVVSAGALCVLTLRDAFLAQLYVPPVGPGRCVPTARYPCGGKSVNPTTGGTQVTPRSSSSSRSLSRAAAPASTGVPCRDVSWSDDQKRQCAQRVQKSCTASFPKDPKKRAQCVYDGITGTGVTPPPLNKTTLPAPQASTKTWDGTYGANGTLTCTNTTTGKKASKDVGEAWTVTNNVVTDINGGRTTIDTNGNVTFTVQSSDLAFTYRLHFARSGNGISVSGSATGGGTVTGSDGTVASVQCTFPLSGSGVPSSSSSLDTTPVSPAAQNTPCQGSLRDQKSCIQRARMYCGAQFPSKTGSAYNQCVYDKMTTGGSDNTSGGGANNAGAGSPGIESSSSSSEPPAPPPEPEPAPPPAKNCGDYPVYPDCRGRCAGLPSYPTYQFEDCLTKCGNDFGAVQAAYNKCMGW